MEEKRKLTIGQIVKRTLLIIFILLILLMFYGWSLEDEENVNEDNVSEALGLKDGCYYEKNDIDSLNNNVDQVFGKILYCFNDNKEYYEVIKANNTFYYNETLYFSAEFESDDIFAIDTGSGNVWNCEVTGNETFECTDPTGFAFVGTSEYIYQDLNIDRNELEKYPVDVSININLDGEVKTITYRPLDLISLSIQNNLIEGARFYPWVDRDAGINGYEWAMTPPNLSEMISQTGLDFNDYIETYCLYEVYIDGEIVEANYESFIPFGAEEIKIVKK